MDRALCGKMYNRSVRSIKVVFEALSRILINEFQQKIEDDIEKKYIVNNVMVEIEDLNSNLNQENFEQLMLSEKISSFTTMWIDLLEDLTENGGELACYWLSFLEMAKILLNLLCATRAGLWDLFLETIRDIIPYTFAYDNINYSRYLTVMLGDLTAIESEFPNVYQEFKHGNFTAQLEADHPFARMKPDKIIECTINKDTKTPGGTTGFSTKSPAVMRWTLNAAYRADLRKKLYGVIDYAPQKFNHKDLRVSRIARDEKDVLSVINIFENVFINPFSQNKLLCISNGLVATEDVKKDLLQAKERGKAAMEVFIFVDEWKSGAAEIIGSKILYVAFEEKCLRFYGSNHTEERDLFSNQEEADSRMLLHIKYESDNDNAERKKFVIHTPDTDVLIISLGNLHNINGDIFMRTGTGDRSRTISLQRIKDKLEQRIGDREVSTDELCEALVGYHAFTGCDSVSTFAGKGKKKAWKIVQSSAEYVEAFRNLGKFWDISTELLDTLEMFVCKLYCKSGGSDLNELRYKIYCSKRGKLTCDDLPPCNSAFVQHCKRANYQSCIWRHALQPTPDIPSPDGYGWNYGDVEEEQNLKITWMTCRPAPDEVKIYIIQPRLLNKVNICTINCC